MERSTDDSFYFLLSRSINCNRRYIWYLRHPMAASALKRVAIALPVGYTIGWMAYYGPSAGASGILR